MKTEELPPFPEGWEPDIEFTPDARWFKCVKGVWRNEWMSGRPCIPWDKYTGWRRLRPKQPAKSQAESQPERPNYYKPDDLYEAIKVIQAWNLDFCLGNVLKYIARAGKKETASYVEDLKKAKTYIEFAIQKAEGK